MELKIKSKILETTFVFTKQAGDSKAIFVASQQLYGRNNSQICINGSLQGSTILSNDAAFKDVCKRWYRSFLRKHN